MPMERITKAIFGSQKIWGKMQGKKNRGKVEGSKRWRKQKKDLESIDYFFMLLQTYFTYFNSSIKIK